MGNPAEEVIFLTEVPEMTDELREIIRKALTKKRPPDNPPPAPSAS
jgi:hypothetical protein